MGIEVAVTPGAPAVEEAAGPPEQRAIPGQGLDGAQDRDLADAITSFALAGVLWQYWRQSSDRTHRQW